MSRDYAKTKMCLLSNVIKRCRLITMLLGKVRKPKMPTSAPTYKTLQVYQLPGNTSSRFAAVLLHAHLQPSKKQAGRKFCRCSATHSMGLLPSCPTTNCCVCKKTRMLLQSNKTRSWCCKATKSTHLGGSIESINATCSATRAIPITRPAPVSLRTSSTRAFCPLTAILAVVLALALRQSPTRMARAIAMAMARTLLALLAGPHMALQKQCR